MLLSIANFFRTPAGRKLAFVTGFLALVGAAFTATYYRGRTEGVRIGQERNVDGDRRQMESERAVLEQRAVRGESRAQQAELNALRSLAAAEQAVAALRAINAERAAAGRTVAAMPDDALVADVARKLKLREPDDVTPALQPREIRAVDEIVTDYALLTSENAVLQQRQGALEKAVRALEVQIDAVQEQRDAWKTWAIQVETHYVKVYNALPRKGNRFLRVITFGLAGKPKKLAYPSPMELHSDRPGGGE